MFINRKEFGVLRTNNVYILYIVRGRRRDKMKKEKKCARGLKHPSHIICKGL